MGNYDDDDAVPLSNGYLSGFAPKGYKNMDSALQLQQKVGTPGATAVMQTQEAIQRKLDRINLHKRQHIPKNKPPLPGKTGYKYMGELGPKLNIREGVIPTMVHHMDQMAANMHAVANHLHRINTGNLHGYGPVPLNKQERKVLHPTLKAYSNGAKLPKQRFTSTYGIPGLEARWQQSRKAAKVEMSDVYTKKFGDADEVDLSRRR